MEATWVHFGFKNRSKSKKKRLRKGTKFSIDFGTDFSSIFGPFWGPRWGHVGAVFGQEPLPEAPGGENPLKSAPPEPFPIFHRFASSSKRAPGRPRGVSGGSRGGSGRLWGASGGSPGGLQGGPVRIQPLRALRRAGRLFRDPRSKQRVGRYCTSCRERGRDTLYFNSR